MRDCFQKFFILVAFCFLYHSLSAEVKRVACVGDSITYGLKIKSRKMDSYPSRLGHMLGPNYTVANFGHSSRTLLKKGRPSFWKSPLFSAAKNFLPDVVVIQLGTNDCKDSEWKGEDIFVKDYKALIKEFELLPSKPRIFLCLPPPVFPSKRAIQPKGITDRIIPAVRRVAHETGLPLIDNFVNLQNAKLFPDAVHPNKEGALLLAENVYKALTKGKTVSNTKTIETSTLATARFEMGFWNNRFKSILQKSKDLESIDLLMIGDSIAHGWEKRGRSVWNENFPEVHLLNCAISGDRTENAFFIVRELPLEKLLPKKAIILIGTNNIDRFNYPKADTASAVVKGIQAIVNEVLERSMKTEVVIYGVFPRGQNKQDKTFTLREVGDEINHLLKSWSENVEGVTFRDITGDFLKEDSSIDSKIFYDYLHPTALGYEVWAKDLKQVL